MMVLSLIQLDLCVLLLITGFLHVRGCYPNWNHAETLQKDNAIFFQSSQNSTVFWRGCRKEIHPLSNGNEILNVIFYPVLQKVTVKCDCQDIADPEVTVEGNELECNYRTYHNEYYTPSRNCGSFVLRSVSRAQTVTYIVKDLWRVSCPLGYTLPNGESNGHAFCDSYTGQWLDIPTCSRPFESPPVSLTISSSAVVPLRSVKKFECVNSASSLHPSGLSTHNAVCNEIVNPSVCLNPSRCSIALVPAATSSAEQASYVTFYDSSSQLLSMLPKHTCPNNFEPTPGHTDYVLNCQGTYRSYRLGNKPVCKLVSTTRTLARTTSSAFPITGVPFPTTLPKTSTPSSGSHVTNDNTTKKERPDDVPLSGVSGLPGFHPAVVPTAQVVVRTQPVLSTSGSGQLDEQKTEKTGEKQAFPVIPVAAGVSAGAAIILLVLAMGLCYRRRRLNQLKNSSTASDSESYYSLPFGGKDTDNIMIGPYASVDGEMGKSRANRAARPTRAVRLRSQPEQGYYAIAFPKEAGVVDQETADCQAAASTLPIRGHTDLDQHNKLKYSASSDNPYSYACDMPATNDDDAFYAEYSMPADDISNPANMKAKVKMCNSVPPNYDRLYEEISDDDVSACRVARDGRERVGGASPAVLVEWNSAYKERDSGVYATAKRRGSLEEIGSMLQFAFENRTLSLEEMTENEVYHQPTQ